MPILASREVACHGQSQRASRRKTRCSRPPGLETEVFAYGRMPLAFSARCFTARHRNLPKDDCQFSCLAHADGLMMCTRESEGFLVLNGTQTQSARVYNLLPELDAMRELGVDVVRLSPQAQHTPDIVKLFHSALTQQVSVIDAMQAMSGLMPDVACNGYWYRKPGLDQIPYVVGQTTLAARGEPALSPTD